MKRMFAVIAQTFLLLRRDKVFMPVAVMMLLSMLFAHIASFWGIAEFDKILFDVGLTGIGLTGIFVAIFWGTKLIADSKREGSLELELAAPISRGYWVVGRFIGLCTTLIFIGMLMMLTWQLFMLLNYFGWMKPRHLVIFGFQILSWIVMASLSVCIASLAAQTTAMFTCFSLWIVGSMTENIAISLHKETPEWMRGIARVASEVWNLQHFNLIAYSVGDPFPPQEQILGALAYGLVVILFCISAGAILFTRKDVVTQ